MLEGHNICVVIPAKNEEKFIKKVIETLPNFVDLIIVIDDQSSDRTRIEAENANSNIKKIVAEGLGKGVGSAIDMGYRIAIDQNQNQNFIASVMAGDGQMNPLDLRGLIEPILRDEADHVKGNRFLSPSITKMPTQRRIASKILSFGTSLAAAQKINDSQCGFTATSSDVLRSWDWSRSWEGYGYPNYWIIECSRLGFRISEVEVNAIYGDEVSGIKPARFFFTALSILTRQHHKRAFFWLTKRPNLYSSTSLLFYLGGWALIISPIWTSKLSSLQLMGLLLWYFAHLLDRGARNLIRKRKSGRTRI